MKAHVVRYLGVDNRCGLRVKILPPHEGFLMTTTFPQPGFGRLHFAGVALGDARPEKRLIELADLLVTGEADSSPDKLANPADYRAFNAIVNRVQTTYPAVLAPYRLRQFAVGWRTRRSTVILFSLQSKQKL
jgi:hypothetical protein